MKPTVLVVDDDEAITKQLFWILSEDYDVVTANDMQTAVRRATIYQPDLSILDLQMPPENESLEVGLRLLEYLQAHLPESKVLVMTAANAIEARKACNAMGVDDFLFKPFATEQLLTMTRRMAPWDLEVV